MPHRSHGLFRGNPVVDGRIEIVHTFDRCRHGSKLQEVYAERSFGMWLIIGHYPCPHCAELSLDEVDTLPEHAMTAGRILAVRVREQEPTLEEGWTIRGRSYSGTVTSWSPHASRHRSAAKPRSVRWVVGKAHH
jgi:hypothetical protein